MPRPIAAGVLGMARTSRAVLGNRRARSSMDFPAMIETITLSPVSHGRMAGAAASSI
jgi:hypothetical protein